MPGSKARRTHLVTYFSLLRSDHFSWPSPCSRHRILHSSKSIDSSRWRISSLQDLCFSSAWMNTSSSCSPPPASFAFRGRVTFAGTHHRPFDRCAGTTDRYRTKALQAAPAAGPWQRQRLHPQRNGRKLYWFQRDLHPSGGRGYRDGDKISRLPRASSRARHVRTQRSTCSTTGLRWP